MLYFPGNEVIDFQAKSQLGKKLTDLFADVLDYRDHLDYPIDSTEAAQREFRIKQVHSYVRQVTIPEFKRIVRSEAGFEVHRVELTEPDDGVTFEFAVDTSFDDAAAAFELQTRSSGANTDTGQSLSKRRLEELAAASENVDLATGRLKSNIFKTNRTISVDICLDVNTAFLIHDFATTTIPEFDADEIAAIMMHEIGHVITILEKMKTMYYCRDRLESYKVNLKNLSREESVEVLKNAVTVARKTLNKNKNTKTGNATIDRWYTKIDATADVFLQHLEEQTDKLDEPDANESSGLLIILSDLGTFVWNVILRTLLVLIGTRLLLTTFIRNVVDIANMAMALCEAIRMGKASFNSNDGSKRSDSTSTQMNFAYVERWADEFVARQGYGVPLASALSKLDRYMQITSMSGSNMESFAMRNSVLFRLLCEIVGKFLDIFNPWIWMPTAEYEPQFERISRIRQEMYAIFKNSNLPGKVRDDWIMSIERLDAEVKNAKSLRNTAVVKAISHIIATITFGKNWPHLLLNANLERDYQRLQDNLDDLFNNPLYYQAARIQRLYGR